VPDAVLVEASGSDGRRLNLGHFAAHRWQVAGNDRHEVLVGGEGLQRGPTDVLGTLLPEAAHGLAQARGIADTSRQGRYHNRRYAQLARELGLDVTVQAPIGWSATTVPEATANCYAAQLQQLGAAGVVAPAGDAQRQRWQGAQPAGLHLPMRPQGPRRQGHPHRGADPLRPLRATLPTR
jgi:hypothetical protein